MKIKNLLVVAFAAIMSVTACKKDEEKEPEPQPQAETLDGNVTQFNADANYYKSESDQAVRAPSSSIVSGSSASIARTRRAPAMAACS